MAKLTSVTFLGLFILLSLTLVAQPSPAAIGDGLKTTKTKLDQKAKVTTTSSKSAQPKPSAKPAANPAAKAAVKQAPMPATTASAKPSVLTKPSPASTTSSTLPAAKSVSKPVQMTQAKPVAMPAASATSNPVLSKPTLLKKPIMALAAKSKKVTAKATTKKKAHFSGGKKSKNTGAVAKKSNKASSKSKLKNKPAKTAKTTTGKTTKAVTKAVTKGKKDSKQVAGSAIKKKGKGKTLNAKTMPRDTDMASDQLNEVSEDTMSASTHEFKDHTTAENDDSGGIGTATTVGFMVALIAIGGAAFYFHQKGSQISSRQKGDGKTGSGDEDAQFMSGGISTFGDTAGGFSMGGRTDPGSDGNSRATKRKHT